MRIAVLAPTDSSLYSRMVVHLAAGEPGVEVVAVVVRSIWSLRRFRVDLRRDGPRLIEKIYQKMILREAAYPAADPDTLLARSRLAALPSSGLAGLARAHRIPYLRASDHNAARAREFLRSARPDVIAFTGGGLVREGVLEIAPLGVLNCHMGILPSYRGMDVVEWPILEGHPDLLGLTLHRMDRGVDTGPILLRRPLALRPGESLAAFRRRLEAEMPGVMLEALRGLRDGTLRAFPQDPGAGRQYFVLHPRLRSLAAQRIGSGDPASPGA